MLAKQAKEIVKCAESFAYFSENYCKTVHSLKGLISLKLQPWQIRLADALEENKFVVATKWRCGGLATVTMMYCLWLCMFKEKQSILWICKSLREAEHCAEMISLVMEFFPVWLKPRMARNNKHEKEFAATESRMCFYNPTASRGRSVTHLIIDEAAYIPEMEYHWKCMWPCLSTGGKCFMLSTPNRGVNGTWFAEMYLGALENKNAFYVFKSHYKECKDYEDEAFVNGLKLALGEEGWAIEVEQEVFKGLTAGVIDAGSDPTEVKSI